MFSTCWRPARSRSRGGTRVPLEARHICILFRRFQGYQTETTKPYVRALEARRVPHVLLGGRSFLNAKRSPRFREYCFMRLSGLRMTSRSTRRFAALSGFSRWSLVRISKHHGNVASLFEERGWGRNRLSPCLKRFVFSRTCIGDETKRPRYLPGIAWRSSV